MLRTQTIVVPIDRGLVFEKEEINEETKEKEYFFIETDFDIKFSEFINGLMLEKKPVISITTMVSPEHIAAVVMYNDEAVDGQGHIVKPDIQVLKTPS